LFIDKTTHKIINVEVNGNTANIKVDTTTVDLNIITREFTNAAFKAEPQENPLMIFKTT